MWKKWADSGGSPAMCPMPRVYLSQEGSVDPQVNVWPTILGLETSGPLIAGQSCLTCAQLNP